MGSIPRWSWLLPPFFFLLWLFLVIATGNILFVLPMENDPIVICMAPMQFWAPNTFSSEITNDANSVHEQDSNALFSAQIMY